MKKQILLSLLLSLSFIGFSQTPITASISYQGYDESQAYLGQGEYEIFTDNTDGVFDKIIIVVDGFDPGDTRDITNMYSSLDYNGTNIADQLRAEGFDFVFLNFPTYTRASDDVEVNGGVDYIQRNAMVLTELITQMNTDKIGAEQLVIVGPSMGGLITRYALRYMEQNSLSHDTRLFVSWDTPHNGANIPIALQYLLNYFAEVNDGNADLQAMIASMFNSPASKQMLIDQFSAHIAGGSTFEQDATILLPTGAVSFRDAFQTEIDAMGFPQQTRNISIANGSGIGTLTGTPGMEILNDTFDVPEQNNVTVEIVLHFAPTLDQTIEVASAITRYFSVPIAEFTADSQSFSYTDGLDSAPGGKYDIQSFVGGTSGLGAEVINSLQQSEFCFIPTTSALAITNESDWNASIDIPSTHSTPFDAWYVPDSSEYHVTPNSQNMAFVLPEIRNESASVNESNFDTTFSIKNNPVATEVTILSKYDCTDLEVSVVGVTGKKLVSKFFNQTGSDFTIPVNLSNGIYFIKIETEGKMFVKPIIVKN